MQFAKFRTNPVANKNKFLFAAQTITIKNLTNCLIILIKCFGINKFYISTCNCCYVNTNKRCKLLENKRGARENKSLKSDALSY